MAVTDDLPGVEVAVTVNGNDLQVYRDNGLEEDHRTTTRYIEAQSGQTFVIRMLVPQGFAFKGNCIAFEIFVDGQRAARSFVDNSDCRRSPEQRKITGVTNTAGERRKFGFTAIETVSEGRIQEGEADKVKRLGTVEVHVIHKRTFRRNTGKTRGSSGRRIADPEVMSEKALKGQALSHCVQLGPPEKGKAEIVAGCANPAAISVFKYLFLESRKAMLLVPRTPTPPPLEERDVMSLTPDELRELQKRAKEFQNQKEADVKIKREKLKEQSGRRRKVARRATDSTQLEVEEDGGFRSSSTATPSSDREVIEVD